MIAKLRNERGISLVEIISAMMIGVILIMASAVGITAFFKRYKDLSDFQELQKGAMNCLTTIRTGYSMNRGEQFWGVANAKNIEITGTGELWNYGSGIKISPPISMDIQAHDMVHFYLDDGFVKVKYIYNGVETASAEYLFPSRKLRDKIEVTTFAVSDANEQGQLLNLDTVSSAGVNIVHVNLKARVKVRDAVKASDVEYKTVDYSTYMVKK